MRDIPVYVSCKFEMYIFKIALVISENVRIAFLYVLSIFLKQSIETVGEVFPYKTVSNHKRLLQLLFIYMFQEHYSILQPILH